MPADFWAGAVERVDGSGHHQNADSSCCDLLNAVMVMAATAVLVDSLACWVLRSCCPHTVVRLPLAALA